jgi:1,2-dihydroxy-3-keto-5-methylthiopentene dioxygenase
VAVCFFVAGSDLFSLHVNGKVYGIRCEQGDLIGVPDGTRHWFDMGQAPSFIAIRFFFKYLWLALMTAPSLARGGKCFVPMISDYSKRPHPCVASM